MRMMHHTWGTRYPHTWDACARASTQTRAGTAAPGRRGRWLARPVHDPEGGFAVRVGETRDDRQAYEHSVASQAMCAPRLRQWCAGAYTTDRCQVQDAQCARSRHAGKDSGMPARGNHAWAQAPKRCRPRLDRGRAPRLVLPWTVRQCGHGPRGTTRYVQGDRGAALDHVVPPRGPLPGARGAAAARGL
jgi:hypothetical protein